jgi:hypothetical protein
MAATDAQDAQDVRTERRLRLGIRLVFYPLCLGLIALAWTHYRGPATHVPPPIVSWIGATEQGYPVRALTFDGVLISVRTRTVTSCLDGSSFFVRLYMTSKDFKRTGDIIIGRQGPMPETSNQGEPVLIANRMRVRMGDQPRGTILSEVTRSPGSHSVQCRSQEMSYTLNRAPVADAKT